MRLPLHLSLHDDAFFPRSIICACWCEISLSQKDLRIKAEQVIYKSHLQLLSILISHEDLQGTNALQINRHTLKITLKQSYNCFLHELVIVRCQV